MKIKCSRFSRLNIDIYIYIQLVELVYITFYNLTNKLWVANIYIYSCWIYKSLCWPVNINWWNVTKKYF